MTMMMMMMMMMMEYCLFLYLLFPFLLQKLFVVPAFTELQARIPFARVNHNKYMVTDSVAYIGEAPFVNFALNKYRSPL